MFGRVTVDGMKRAQAIDRLNEGRDRDDGAYCGGGRVAGCESGTASLIGKGMDACFVSCTFPEGTADAGCGSGSSFASGSDSKYSISVIAVSFALNSLIFLLIYGQLILQHPVRCIGRTFQFPS